MRSVYQSIEDCGVVSERLVYHTLGKLAHKAVGKFSVCYESWIRVKKVLKMMKKG